MNAVWMSRLKGGPARSRFTRSQAAWRIGAAAQCTWRPQGPLLARHEVQTKPSAVSGVFGMCFAQSESRTPEQSVSQWAAPCWASFWLKPVPSAVGPQPGLTVWKKPWPTHEASRR